MSTNIHLEKSVGGCGVGRKPTPKERKNPKEKVRIDMKWTSRGDRGSQKKQIGACHVQNATWSWPCPRGMLSMVGLFGNLACFHGPGACVARLTSARPGPAAVVSFQGRTAQASARERALACLLGPWRLGSCYKVLEKSKKEARAALRQQAFSCSWHVFLVPRRVALCHQRLRWRGIADCACRLTSLEATPSTQDCACHVDFFGSNPSSLSLSLSLFMFFFSTF